MLRRKPRAVGGLRAPDGSVIPYDQVRAIVTADDRSRGHAGI